MYFSVSTFTTAPPLSAFVIIISLRFWRSFIALCSLLLIFSLGRTLRLESRFSLDAAFMNVSTVWCVCGGVHSLLYVNIFSSAGFS